MRGVVDEGLRRSPHASETECGRSHSRRRLIGKQLCVEAHRRGAPGASDTHICGWITDATRAGVLPPELSRDPTAYRAAATAALGDLLRIDDHRVSELGDDADGRRLGAWIGVSGVARVGLPRDAAWVSGTGDPL